VKKVYITIMSGRIISGPDGFLLSIDEDAPGYGDFMIDVRLGRNPTDKPNLGLFCRAQCNKAYG
jgi:hypothetical protein